MTPALETTVDELVEQLSLPGAAAAVVRPGQLPEVAVRGHADLATDRLVDLTTQFRIGSITKTMTTLLVLQLVEAGELDLDDPVTHHVEVALRQPRSARRITIRDLLTHRSGLGEIASWSALRHPLWAVGGCAPDRPPPTLAELAASGYRAEFAPGEKWVYANPGFTLLGRMIEQVTGEGYGDLLSERIFAPCGMTGATLDPAEAPDLAVGYKQGSGGFVPVRRFGVATVSAGGVIATIGDLASYATMLMAGGLGSVGRVIEEDTLAEAFRVQFRPHPALKGIGLTFRIRRHGALELVGHNGSMPGWNSGLVLCPELGIGAVALVNRAVPPSAEFGGGRLAQAVLTEAVPRSSHPESRGRAVTFSAPYIGSYRPLGGALTNVRANVLFGGRVHVEPAGTGLSLRGSAGLLRRPTVLRPDDKDAQVFHLDLRGVDLPVAFDRPESGRSSHLWLDGIPTGFSLHRIPDGWGRRRSVAASVALAVGVGLGWVARRRGRQKR